MPPKKRRDEEQRTHDLELGEHAFPMRSPCPERITGHQCQGRCVGHLETWSEYLRRRQNEDDDRRQRHVAETDGRPVEKHGDQHDRHHDKARSAETPKPEMR